ncbi:pilus assembly protein PilM [Clostridium niameyense]|uniref:pilus assembly protein PilM n=1 Tax=Clostridium niameyense TaxID=1622073 RepID=UPI0013D40B8F|nr:pilus assembly protein PilM [Clostridium niameyense]
MDLGNNNTKIVSGKIKKNKIYINNLAVIENSKDLISDGKINSYESLFQLLDESLGMYDFKEIEAIITSNSTLIINREIIVPKAEGKELESIIQFEIQQYLPINMEEYILQHKIIENIKEENIEKLRIFVVVYPKILIEDYVKLLDSLDLEPKALDINPNSINKLFKDDIKINEEDYKKDNTIGIIDMGSEQLTISIFSKGQLEFSRIIDRGGKNIDKAISTNFHIKLKDAEKRKKNHCDLMIENKVEYMEELNYIIKKEITIWIEEILRIINYYKSKKTGNVLDKLYLYGGSSRLKGIDKYISKDLNIAVEKINSMSNIVFSKDVYDNDIDYCLNAIGALIRL